MSTSEEQTQPYSQNDSLVELKSHPDCPLLIDTDQRVATEYFGVLRSRLLNARTKSSIRSVVITSPQKQDGKTFTSINLAISLAQLRQLRILLVEGDLRRTGVTRILGQEHSSGLADFLQDWTRFEACVKATMLSHLYVAPAGNLTPDSVPAILEGERWPKFIERAREEFDLVIVDSVPVSAPIADFELLLNPCDAALLVVHVRKTARQALDISADRMQGKLLGVVVNNKQLPARFDYETSYGKNQK